MRAPLAHYLINSSHNTCDPPARTNLGPSNRSGTLEPIWDPRTDLQAGLIPRSHRALVRS